jgi:hypothetical protein
LILCCKKIKTQSARMDNFEISLAPTPINYGEPLSDDIFCSPLERKPHLPRASCGLI